MGRRAAAGLGPSVSSGQAVSWHLGARQPAAVVLTAALPGRGHMLPEIAQEK